ncbi:hypothetical protein [Capillibacterium thermochitinicola]|uniref:hypothetical protein n=1 Tax=Capillibacterium thermochitinicola TaxID=2699427 RepID=UPI001E4A3021|nr:hypothetical protein [Capillibacterium thermochitinicola]
MPKNGIMEEARPGIKYFPITLSPFETVFGKHSLWLSGKKKGQARGWLFRRTLKLTQIKGEENSV